MILDATNLLVGRFATKVAKAALLGEEVHIINCENAIISGSSDFILQKYVRFNEMGTPTKGPFYPKQSHMLVKRVIRGMLPYKKKNGREAYSRIKCHIGTLPEFEGKAITMEEANVAKLPVIKYVKMSQIAQKIGGKQ